MDKLPGNLLVIDVASHHVQVGIFDGIFFRWKAFKWSADPFIECFDELMRDVCAAACSSIRAIDAFAMCVGPGSLLGLRAAKMCVDVWNSVGEKRPIYAYNALHLCSENLLRQGMKDFSLRAPIQRQKEAFLCVSDGKIVDGPRFISATNDEALAHAFVFPMRKDSRAVVYDLEAMEGILGDFFSRIIPSHFFDPWVILNEFATC